MGSGDWNDGMNLAGEHGKGKSVCLGFFLYEVLTRFAEVARAHGDSPFAEHCQWEAARVRQNIKQNGWDGAWYRRAYFDDYSCPNSTASIRLPTGPVNWGKSSVTDFRMSNVDHTCEPY
jgi:cellobiose phosphorylase